MQDLEFRRMLYKKKYGVDPMAKFFNRHSNKEEFNQEMRKSYFAPEENFVSVDPKEDGEAMQEGVDVLKKRRGSIFGNNIGTIFGN